ncbi:MAG TPA: DUF1801 domain-containing protein [Ferruginibacter sp.]|nr:DUF1801 domain-containing protein [Ferruginibacter sp.]
MTVKEQIKQYISTLQVTKANELQTLHKHIMQIKPAYKLWFLDGKDDKGKIVSNPNIGYGSINLKYKDGSSKEFYQIGLSANTTGISVYIMGINNKNYLAETFGKRLGKASVTGYCIKFKTLKDINITVLEEAIQFGFENIG